jgi:hypothetical protein
VTLTSAIYHRCGQHPVRPPHPETPASSWRTGSSRDCGATSGRSNSTRRRNRPMGRAIKIASPGLSPTAIAMIVTAQSGRLSMARCPRHIDEPSFSRLGYRIVDRRQLAHSGVSRNSPSNSPMAFRRTSGGTCGIGMSLPQTKKRQFRAPRCYRKRPFSRSYGKPFTRRPGQEPYLRDKQPPQPARDRLCARIVLRNGGPKVPRNQCRGVCCGSTGEGSIGSSEL